MENRIKSKISVTFYLKKMSHDDAVKKRAVYTTIAFSGTSAKMSTGMVCEDPKIQWRKGMFEGRKFTDENLELLSIRNKIEAFDTRFCKSANHIKDLYHGINLDDIPMTILEVFNESLEKKHTKVKSATIKCFKGSISIFKLWMKETQRPDFGVVQSHPNKITKRLIQQFYNWDLERVKESTANNHIFNLHHLYELFHNINVGDIDGLVPNPFKRIVELEDKQERVKKALERDLDWKWIEKIENLKYKLPEGVVINEIELWDKEWLLGKDRETKRVVKEEKFRLLTLILAYTGLSFVDLGKADVLNIHRTITGPVLSGRRVKTKKIYTIPVTPKLDSLIKELGSLPWKPFVNDKNIKDYKRCQRSYVWFSRYLTIDLSEQIGFDEDITLTAHRFRHSFAMRMLNHYRFSLTNVARMLGDREDTVEENYANQDDDTIMKIFHEEMARFNKRQQEEDEDLESEVAV
jgi:integrase